MYSIPYTRFQTFAFEQFQEFEYLDILDLKSRNDFLYVLTFYLHKWRIFSQPGKIGTGKNTKSLFFLLGLKYTLRTCFESKNFSSNSFFFTSSYFAWLGENSPLKLSHCPPLHMTLVPLPLDYQTFLQP